MTYRGVRVWIFRGKRFTVTGAPNIKWEQDG